MTTFIHPSLEIRTTPDSGRWYFATTPIPQGTLLLSELPFISVADHLQQYPNEDSTYNLAFVLLSDRNLISLTSPVHNLYSTADPAADLLSAAPADVLTLAASAGLSHRDFAMLLSRISLNSMDLAYFPERLTFSPYDPSQATALFPSAALFNHSCHPNAFRYSDGRTLLVRAACDLGPNDHVTLSYIPNAVLLEPAAIRHQYLHGRDFICHCHLGQSNTAEVEEEQMELDIQTRAELLMMDDADRIDAINDLLEEGGFLMGKDELFLLTLLGRTGVASVWKRAMEVVDARYPAFDFTRVVVRWWAGEKDQAKMLAKMWYDMDEIELEQIMKDELVTRC